MTNITCATIHMEPHRKDDDSAEQLIHQAAVKDFVNGGGTGSMESTCREDAVTEITVGSGFYNSHLFDYYTNFRMKPAAAFAITSNSASGTITTSRHCD